MEMAVKPKPTDAMLASELCLSLKTSLDLYTGRFRIRLFPKNRTRFVNIFQQRVLSRVKTVPVAGKRRKTERSSAVVLSEAAPPTGQRRQEADMPPHEGLLPKELPADFSRQEIVHL